MGNRLQVKIIFLLSMFVLSIPAVSQEDSTESYTRILKFGIESQVVDVLGKLIEEKDYGYNTLLLSVISETGSAEVRELIFQLWTEGEFGEGEEYARAELEKLIESLDESNRQTGLAAIKFLTEISARESLPLLIEVMDYANTFFAGAAVRAIGKIATMEDYDIAARLLSKLQNIDPVLEEDLFASIVLSLGELRYVPATEYLVNVLEDTDSSDIHKGYACISLGKIGREEDFNLVKSIYTDSSSSTVRLYALSGLAEFENIEVSDILLQALKRDSYWKIRVRSAEKIGQLKAWPNGADELLMFKALNDPVSQVRDASIKSMGNSKNPIIHDFLQENFSDSEKTDSIRLATLSALIENRIPGTRQALLNVMISLWDKKNDRLLEFISRELARKPWKDLADVYEKMLGHSNWLIKLYAIRAIRDSEISTPSIDDKLNKLDSESKNKNILKELRKG